MKKRVFQMAIVIGILSAAFFCNAFAQQQSMADQPVSVVYITGIGCSNCAVTDPALFVEATSANPELIIVEYEIYRHRQANAEVKDLYFENYVGGQRSGIPFLVISKENNVIGRFKVLDAASTLKEMETNSFPKWDGTAINFNDLDLTELPGAPNIWTKNRVLIHGQGGNDRVLKKILLNENLSEVLRGVDYKEVEPVSVAVSQGEIHFDYAVLIDGWRLQWKGEALTIAPEASSEKAITLMMAALMILIIAFSFFNIKVRKVKKGVPITVEFRGRWRDLVIASVSIGALIVFFVAAKNITPDFLQQIGYDMPLPIFTLLIALVDGFNPCNMFVLTCLLALLISTSQSKRRLYIVSLCFVGMVYLFYFFFMALWLNVFKYISFITPLRIGIALIAIGAGIINCKELFFFKKGISLTIPDKQKGPLMKRIERMKDVIQHGSMPLLISSSLGLAALSSLIELPCTAGFPIIYTGILSGRGLDNTFSYYLYLMYYNFVYITPLAVIIFIFIHTLRARHITQRQMEVIKFVGGIIMLLLGIVLLVNPGLLGLRM